MENTQITSNPSEEKKSGKGIWIILGVIIVVFAIILGMVFFIEPKSGDGSEFYDSDLAKEMREQMGGDNPNLSPDSGDEVSDNGGSDLDSATAVMESFLERSDSASCVSTSITKVDETGDYFDFWILQTSTILGTEIDLDAIYVYDRNKGELTSVKVTPENYVDSPDALNEWPISLQLEGVVAAEEMNVVCP
jgi:hypothetical protein